MRTSLKHRYLLQRGLTPRIPAFQFRRPLKPVIRTPTLNLETVWHPRSYAMADLSNSTEFESKSFTRSPRFNLPGSSAADNKSIAMLVQLPFGPLPQQLCQLGILGKVCHPPFLGHRHVILPGFKALTPSLPVPAFPWTGATLAHVSLYAPTLGCVPASLPLGTTKLSQGCASKNGVERPVMMPPSGTMTQTSGKFSRLVKCSDQS